MYRLTKNPRKYSKQAILATSQSMLDAGYIASKPITLTDKKGYGEVEKPADVIRRLFDSVETITLHIEDKAVKKATSEVIEAIDKLTPKTGAKIVDGRGRWIACLLCQVFGVDITPTTVEATDPEIDELRLNTIELTINRISSEEQVKAAIDLHAAKRVSIEADLAKIGVKRGIRQRGFAVAELVNTYGMDKEWALTLDKESARKARDERKKDTSADDVLAMYKGKVAPTARISKTDLEKIADDLPVFKPFVAAILENRPAELRRLVKAHIKDSATN